MIITWALQINQPPNNIKAEWLLKLNTENCLCSVSSPSLGQLQ